MLRKLTGRREINNEMEYIYFSQSNQFTCHYTYILLVGGAQRQSPGGIRRHPRSKIRKNRLISELFLVSRFDVT
jgi:hypothetical protein